LISVSSTTHYPISQVFTIANEEDMGFVHLNGVILIFERHNPYPLSKCFRLSFGWTRSRIENRWWRATRCDWRWRGCELRPALMLNTVAVGFSIVELVIVFSFFVVWWFSRSRLCFGFWDFSWTIVIFVQKRHSWWMKKLHQFSVSIWFNLGEKWWQMRKMVEGWG
jgi:hypothetical protein